MTNTETLTFTWLYIMVICLILGFRIVIKIEREKQKAWDKLFIEIRKRKRVYRIEGDKMILIYDWRNPEKYPNYIDDGEELS